MIGLNALIYRNTATFATPTWVAVPEFENVTLTPTYAQLPANSRASRIAQMQLGLASVAVTARLKVKPGNTNYGVIMDAFHLKTVLDLLILDAINTFVGATGVRAECFIAAAANDQGMEARLYRDLEIVVADTDNIPQFARVYTGGVLQYAQPGGNWA